jgi:hypothetical protein
MEIYTIELNLDDDFASSCSYHVDDYDRTCKRNIEHALDGRKTQRWVLVGIAHSLKEANEKSNQIQEAFCKNSGREFKSLNFSD